MVGRDFTCVTSAWLSTDRAADFCLKRCAIPGSKGKGPRGSGKPH
jgi:hypothetical protein